MSEPPITGLQVTLQPDGSLLWTGPCDNPAAANLRQTVDFTLQITLHAAGDPTVSGTFTSLPPGLWDEYQGERLRVRRQAAILDGIYVLPAWRRWFLGKRIRHWTRWSEQ